MDWKTRSTLKTLNIAQKATRGIDKSHLKDAVWEPDAVRYSVTVTDHAALRSIIKRLPASFSMYLRGTDGWSIDVSRKALLDLIYCDENDNGMTLAQDGQTVEVTMFSNQTLVEFVYVG